MTASYDLELSHSSCASEATPHQSREQTAASPDKHQVAPITRTVQPADEDQDQGERAAAEERRDAAKEPVRSAARNSTSRAETCCSATTTKATEQSRLEPHAVSNDNCAGHSEQDDEPKGRTPAQARLQTVGGAAPRPRRAGGESRAAAPIQDYNQFLYGHQPQHQAILPMSFHPYQLANPQHLFNYLEQQRQHMLQVAAAQPGFYNQPLASWACTPTETGSIPDAQQLYAPAGLLIQQQQQHQQQPVCALPPNYSQHQLQPVPVVPGGFGPLGVPVANYLPAPAFYTGHNQNLHHNNHHHHHHHLFSQPHQVVVPTFAQTQDKPAGGAVHEQPHRSPSPSVSSSSSDSDAADTSRVIVDGDTVGAVAKDDVSGRQFAERTNKAAPSQGADEKAAEGRNERTVIAMDDERTSAQSNRSTSQLRPAATMLITTTKPTRPDGNLIRRNDIGGSKNGSRREQRRPPPAQQQRGYESESVDGAEADETRQEERKEAVPLGGEDQHAGARVEPFDGGVPLARNEDASRLAADCETPATQSRHHHQVGPAPADTNSSAAEQNNTETTTTTRTTAIDEVQGADDVLMVATIGDSAPPKPKTSTVEAVRDSQLAAGHRDSTQQATSDNHKHETKTSAQQKTNDQQDGRPPTPLAQTGQISINGTTFYHVNPALVRVGMPPPPPPPEPLVKDQQQPVYMYQAANKNLMSYLAPGQPYQQLANDYAHNQMLTLAPSRIAADYFYYWPAPTATTLNSRRFDLMQTTTSPTGPSQQQPLYGPAPHEFDQRPFVALHHHLALPRPFHYEPHYNYLTQQSPFVAQAHQLVPVATDQTSVAVPPVAPQLPPPPTTSSVPGRPQPVNLSASAAAPVVSSSATSAQTPGTGSNGASQLKLGYNLIPLLPISAIPTRVRQAYGMDKVWQDEFEQLFSQFVSQVVWTLVEVETNPNIRSSSRLLAYKGRYIVRVENRTAAPAASSRSEASCSVASTTDQDDKQAQVEPVCDEDEDDDNFTGSWPGGHEHADTCCCLAGDSDGSARREESRQGCLVGSGSSSNSSESDCDSGAVLNSTSEGSSETTSQDLSELNSSQSPASSSPCHMAASLLTGQEISAVPPGPTPSRQTNFQEPANSKGQTGRKFPLKFRMFIDSAKVRFCCDSCGHGWTSMKGRVVFWYELFELIDGSGTADGVSNLIGYCAYKLFGQQCDLCKIENRFERPMWYPEEVTKVLCNFFNKIGQVYFGFRMPAIDKQRRAGKPKTSHNSLLCQACHDGVCTDRK